MTESTLILTVRTRARDRNVMTVQEKAEGLLQVFAQGIKMCGGNLEGRPTLVTREVTMDRARKVVHRGVLVEVRVHHDLERLELFEDPIDGGRTDVRLTFLDLVRDLVCREVTAGSDEDFGHGALGDRGASIGTSDGRDDLVDLALKFNHGKTLRPPSLQFRR